MILRGISESAIQQNTFGCTPRNFGKGFNFELYDLGRVERLRGIRSITIQANVETVIMGGSAHPYKVLSRTTQVRGQIEGAAVGHEARSLMLPEVQTQTQTSVRPSIHKFTNGYFPHFALGGIAQMMLSGGVRSTGPRGSGHIFIIPNCSLTDYSVTYADDKYTLFDADFTAVAAQVSDEFIEFYEHPNPAIARNATFFGSLYNLPIAGPSPTTVKSFGSKLVGHQSRQIVQNNPVRCSLLLYNAGPATIYVGGATVTAHPLGTTPSGGVAVRAGEHATVLPGEDGNATWAICATGQTATVIYRET